MIYLLYSNKQVAWIYQEWATKNLMQNLPVSWCPKNEQLENSSYDESRTIIPSPNPQQQNEKTLVFWENYTWNPSWIIQIGHLWHDVGRAPTSPISEPQPVEAHWYHVNLDQVPGWFCWNLRLFSSNSSIDWFPNDWWVAAFPSSKIPLSCFPAPFLYSLPLKVPYTQSEKSADKSRSDAKIWWRIRGLTYSCRMVPLSFGKLDGLFGGLMGSPIRPIHGRPILARTVTRHRSESPWRTTCPLTRLVGDPRRSIQRPPADTNSEATKRSKGGRYLS